MPLLSGIYDSEAVQPVCKIKENVSVWTVGKWYHFRVDMIDGFPAGPDNLIDMVNIAGATNIAANGTLAKRLIAALQIDSYELLQLRLDVVDQIEVRVWEQAGQTKNATARTHARVAPHSRTYDPNMSLTTFFIIGSNRDVQIEVFNPNAYALPTARVQFWGLRYLVTEHTTLRGVDDKDKVQAAIGASTWLPAESRIS